MRARNFSFHGVAADAAYKTPWNTKYLMDRQLRPIFPYTRPKGKKGLFRKKEFVYDSHYNCYLCPNDQILRFNTITRDGCRKYSSTPYICENCPLLTQCTTSKQHKKEIHRHLWAAYLEAAEHLRHTAYNKEKYKKRKETIERVFADAKEKHGMRWTKYRGLEKVQVHTMLVFAAMNLKKLANWKWERLFLLIFLLKKKKKQSILLKKKVACFFCLQSGR